jgi:hypothetical protein
MTCLVDGFLCSVSHVSNAAEKPCHVLSISDIYQPNCGLIGSSAVAYW